MEPVGTTAADVICTLNKKNQSENNDGCSSHVTGRPLDDVIDRDQPQWNANQHLIDATANNDASERDQVGLQRRWLVASLRDIGAALGDAVKRSNYANKCLDRPFMTGLFNSITKTVLVRSLSLNYFFSRVLFCYVWFWLTSTRLLVPARSAISCQSDATDSLVPSPYFIYLFIYLFYFFFCICAGFKHWTKAGPA